MRVCHKCGAANPDARDFCACGEYLRWEETGSQPEPVPQRGVADTLVRATPRGVAPVTVVLRLPDREPPKGEPLRHSVSPGQRTRVLALVRNQSGIVDNYDLRIDGLPREWWSIPSGTLYLAPFGSDGTYEQEVEIELHPPRSAEADARVWPLKVVADSRARGSVAAVAPLALRIRPFAETQTVVRPLRRAGRRRATYHVTLTNRSNAPAQATLAGEDPDGELRFGFEPSALEVRPGAALTARMRVHPPRQIWIGRPRERRLEVVTITDHAPAPVQCVFVQRPWLPWWLLAFVAALAVAAVLVVRSLPRTVSVPAIVGAPSVFDAEAELTEAGLTLAPGERTKVDGHARAGSVIGQTPAAGAKVETGAPVSVLIAVGSGKARVPDVTGSTAVEAEKALRGRGLTLGPASPQPVDPKRRIASQIPAAGEVVKAGAPVSIFYATPKPAAAAARPVVPVASTGIAAASFGRRLSAAGFVPHVQWRFDEARRGTVLGTDPPSGTPQRRGGSITVSVSAGFPRIVFSNGRDVLLVDGATGKRLGAVAAGPGIEEDPAWAPDGKRIAFIADGRVYVKALDGSARAVTGPGGGYKDLAWSPRRDVLAVRRGPERDTDLCLIGVGARVTEPSCKAEPSFEIALALHWSPDGTMLLGIGRRPAETSTGIVRWTTRTPFSADADDWSEGEFMTDTEAPGRRVHDVAISLDGKRIAAAANFGFGEHRLWLGDASDLSLESARPTRLRACKVAWRADGRELAVTQADAACEEADGALIRLSPDDPAHTVHLAAAANDPGYEPILPGP